MKYSEYFGAKRRLSFKNENIRYDISSHNNICLLSDIASETLLFVYFSDFLQFEDKLLCILPYLFGAYFCVKFQCVVIVLKAFTLESWIGLNNIEAKDSRGL